MTYIIDRYYAGEREKQTQIVKSQYSLEEMLDILGLIIVLYKEYRPLPKKCNIEDIKDILLKFFESRDVKHKYERELPFIYFRLSCKVLFQGYDMSGNLVVWIDVDEVEEFYRGHNISVLMQKYLSDSQKTELIEFIKERE